MSDSNISFYAGAGNYNANTTWNSGVVTCANVAAHIGNWGVSTDMYMVGAGNIITWEPTAILRFINRFYTSDFSRRVLQQKWIGPNGYSTPKEEWRDVPFDETVVEHQKIDVPYQPLQEPENIGYGITTSPYHDCVISNNRIISN